MDFLDGDGAERSRFRGVRQISAGGETAGMSFAADGGRKRMPAMSLCAQIGQRLWRKPGSRVKVDEGQRVCLGRKDLNRAAVKDQLCRSAMVVDNFGANLWAYAVNPFTTVFFPANRKDLGAITRLSLHSLCTCWDVRPKPKRRSFLNTRKPWPNRSPF